jgi:hypothetical protein
VPSRQCQPWLTGTSVILEVADDPAWRHLMDAPRAMTWNRSIDYDVLQPVASRLEI